MSKVCALCDAGFPARIRDEVPVRVHSIDGKPTPHTVLMLPRDTHEKIVAWYKEGQDDKRTDD